MAMFLGLVVVLTHNVWTGGLLAIVVTLMGWMLLLKAVVSLFFTHGSYKKLLHLIKFEQVYYPCALIVLIIGIFLTYYGFFGY